MTGSARLRNLGLALAPIIFLVWLYREGIDIWFTQDDFAWLGLLRQVHNAHDLIRVLFEPAAQGTIRPWSERGFFLLFEHLFGIDNLPFRLTVFATMAADLLLISWIMRRITGSGLAGAVAGIVWVANASLVTVMTWSSSWNEALCPLFLLAALTLFIRYIETGRAIFWWLQFMVFVLGFGVLEINVVYPAIALAWLLFVARSTEKKLLLSQLPLVAVSIAYFLLHRAVAPLQANGTYVLRFDAEIFKTLAVYLKWSFLPADWGARNGSPFFGRLILSCSFVSVAALAWVEFRRRRRVTLFFAAWFLITLGPLLPLAAHRTDYYLTIPLIGLGMLAGWAVSCAWRAPSETHPNGRWQLIPVAVVVIYLAGMIPVTRTATVWWSVRAEAVRVMVLGVKAARHTHPDSAIVLDGVTTELFNNGIGHSPFYPFGISNVYLTLGSELTIQPVPDLADMRDVVLEPAVLLRALTQDRAVIYSISGDHLRNITEAYRRTAPERLGDRLPGRVDLGNSLYSWLAGPEWLPLEEGFRWMPKRATIRMRGPDSGGNKLSLDGYCPEEQLKRAPRHVVVSIDGLVLGETQIVDPESTFHRLFPLPNILVGKKEMEVEIRVDPVERVGNRELGLVIGRVSIVP